MKLVINMKIAGIIVEYNPLHNGHLHHIMETRRLSECDCLIAVMSGNFTQRGEPAIYDKFLRTKMALYNHVDLVVEIPYILTVQNADVFAYASVDLLNHLGVDEIYFGSESGDVKLLEELSEVIVSDEYNLAIKKYLKDGDSYPTASNNAMNDIYPNTEYSKPNNILGIQYLISRNKINKNIKIKTIKRIYNDYHDTLLNNSHIQSASAIRKLIKDDDFDNYPYKEFIPENVFELIKDKAYNDIELFYNELKYRLNSVKKDELSQILSIDEGIESWFIKHRDFPNVEFLINSLLTRRYTNSKIKRSLMHILLNTKKSELTTFDVPYVRVLGMNNKGRSHLSNIKKEIKVPLITNVSSNIHPYLELDLLTSRIYSLGDSSDLMKEELKPVIFLRFD
ncbi:hypothetical protein CI105_06065 [Candidatus Izimaplasma bacterium ZiA1]|nr:hypothetical protein CI105_06065 [Candidatus Izimaplasma bacterium ZiA1]